jgi:hypothetical protein
MSYERKYKITGGISDIYKMYKKESILNGSQIIDKKTFTKICYEFNKRISNKIITESFEFKIPFGLGYVRIKETKPKLRVKNGKLQTHKMCPNWNETKKLWNRLYPDKTWDEIRSIPNKKIIIHTNEHTDGSVMRWYWDKRLSNFRNQTCYKFKPVKGQVLEDMYIGRLGLGSWIKHPNRINEYYR